MMQIIQLGRTLHPPVSAKRRLLSAIQNYAQCKVEDAWKGGGDPTLIPLIESNLEGATRKLHALVDQLFEDR
jgi:hypothetical protein